MQSTDAIKCTKDDLAAIKKELADITAIRDAAKLAFEDLEGEVAKANDAEKKAKEESAEVERLDKMRK